MTIFVVRMQLRLHIWNVTSHGLLVAARKVAGTVLARMQAGLHGGHWGSNPHPGKPGANVLPTLVALCVDVALRMQVELQTLDLAVAGSSPAGPDSVGP
jgi:hypothetical protein